MKKGHSGFPSGEMITGIQEFSERSKFPYNLYGGKT